MTGQLEVCLSGSIYNNQDFIGKTRKRKWRLTLDLTSGQLVIGYNRPANVNTDVQLLWKLASS